MANNSLINSLTHTHWSGTCFCSSRRIAQLWSRLPVEKVPRSLRLVDGETHAGGATAGAAAYLARMSANSEPPAGHAFTLTTNGPGTSAGGVGNGAPPLSPSRNAAAATPSASVAYESVRACEACFTLHQAEVSLARAERRLATAVGGSRGRDARGRVTRRSKDDLDAGVKATRKPDVGGGNRGGEVNGRRRGGPGGSRSAGSLGGVGIGQGDVPSRRLEVRMRLGLSGTTSPPQETIQRRPTML